MRLCFTWRLSVRLSVCYLATSSKTTDRMDLHKNSNINVSVARQSPLNSRTHPDPESLQTRVMQDITRLTKNDKKVQPMTQPLIYFCRDAAARAGRLNV